MERDAERRADARDALDLDPALVGLDDLARDEQAQSEPAVVRWDRSLELVEDPERVLRRDADSLVRDLDVHEQAVGTGAYVYGPPPSVLDCVSRLVST